MDIVNRCLPIAEEVTIGLNVYVHWMLSQQHDLQAAHCGSPEALDKESRAAHLKSWIRHPIHVRPSYGIRFAKVMDKESHAAHLKSWIGSPVRLP